MTFIVIRTKHSPWGDDTWQGNWRASCFYQASQGMENELPAWPHWHHECGWKCHLIMWMEDQFLGWNINSLFDLAKPREELVGGEGAFALLVIGWCSVVLWLVTTGFSGSFFVCSHWWFRTEGSWAAPSWMYKKQLKNPRNSLLCHPLIPEFQGSLPFFLHFLQSSYAVYYLSSRDFFELKEGGLRWYGATLWGVWVGRPMKL